MAEATYYDYLRGPSERDGRVTIYVDSAAEISSLSTDYAPGSKAIAVGSGTTYILAPGKEWRENGNVDL